MLGVHLFDFVLGLKFVSFASIYANMATHWGGSEGADAAKKASENRNS